MPAPGRARAPKAPNVLQLAGLSAIGIADAFNSRSIRRTRKGYITEFLGYKRGLLGYADARQLD